MVDSEFGPEPDIHLNDPLMYKIAVTVGHRRADGQPVPIDLLDTAITYLTDVFSIMFGGARMLGEAGRTDECDGYQHAGATVVIEHGSTVWAFGSGVDIRITELKTAAAEVAWRLRQETVLLSIEPVLGPIYFVEPRIAEAQPLGVCWVERACEPAAAAALPPAPASLGELEAMIDDVFHDRLSERTRQVLARRVLGFSDAEIAAALFLSESTVRTHDGKLLELFELTSVRQLAAVVFRALWDYYRPDDDSGHRKVW
ncbi:MAG: LuxR C-terminal-related transcriptional regulator [Dehalococcoidia bacterium]